MEQSNAILADPSPSDSHIAALLDDVSKLVHGAIQTMLKMTSEIEQSACEIMEEIEKCKESASVKNTVLEEEKERFQKAAIAVLKMLNGGSEAI